MTDLPEGFNMVLRACGQQNASEMVRNIILIAYKDGIAQGRREQAEKDENIAFMFSQKPANKRHPHDIAEAIRRATGDQDD